MQWGYNQYFLKHRGNSTAPRAFAEGMQVEAGKTPGSIPDPLEWCKISSIGPSVAGLQELEAVLAMRVVVW